MQAFVSEQTEQMTKLNDTKLNQVYLQPSSNDNEEIQNEIRELKSQLESNIENQAIEILELKDWVE